MQHTSIPRLKFYTAVLNKITRLQVRGNVMWNCRIFHEIGLIFFNLYYKSEVVSAQFTFLNALSVGLCLKYFNCLSWPFFTVIYMNLFPKYAAHMLLHRIKAHKGKQFHLFLPLFKRFCLFWPFFSSTDPEIKFYDGARLLLFTISIEPKFTFSLPRRNLRYFQYPNLFIHIIYYMVY